MKSIVLIFIILFFYLNASAQGEEVLRQIHKDEYVQLVHNVETNTMDTLTLILMPNHTFAMHRTGTVNRIEIVGNFRTNKDTLILINRYPFDKFLSVMVVPSIGNCNGELPNLIDGKGNIARGFYLDANHNSYELSIGMIIPYPELDTSGKVRVCSNVGNHCSDWFFIPYKDCYQFVIDMNVEPNKYNGLIKKLYYKKCRKKLLLLKTETSDTLRQ